MLIMYSMYNVFKSKWHLLQCHCSYIVYGTRADQSIQSVHYIRVLRMTSTKWLKQLFNEWQQLKWTLDSFRLACNVWFVLFQHWRKIRMAKSCIKCWNFNEMGFKCWRQQNDELNLTTYVYLSFVFSLFI